MKNNANNHYRVDLSNIIKRLPALRQINASQSALLSFTLAWEQWLSKNIPEDFRQLASLNSFNDGVLSITCETSTVASQLKHLQVSLLEALHSFEHHQILSIRIQTNHSTSNDTHSKPIQVDSKPPVTTRKALNQEVIDAINNCEKNVKSEKGSAVDTELFIFCS